MTAAAAAAAAAQVEQHAKEALRSGLCVVIGLQCTGEAANERAASRAADDDDEGDSEFSELCCPAQDSAPPLRLPPAPPRPACRGGAATRSAQLRLVLVSPPVT